jgi:hypothetical protein
MFIPSSFVELHDFPRLAPRVDPAGAAPHDRGRATCEVEERVALRPMPDDATGEDRLLDGVLEHAPGEQPRRLLDRPPRRVDKRLALPHAHESALRLS